MACLSTHGRALAGFTLLLLSLATPVQAEVSTNHWAGAVRIGPTPLACDGRCRRALISFVAEKLVRRLIFVGIPRALVGLCRQVASLTSC